MLHAVIMAGGSGTRFWPASRANRPKQFLPLFGDETLLQATVRRIADWIGGDRTLIVTNQAHAAETARELPAVPAANIVREPCGRNTAPCIGLAAMLIAQRDPNGVMLVMPADHRIERSDLFREAVDRAVAIVEREPALVLFGIRPSYPSVSFGYLEQGEASAAVKGRFAWRRFAKSRIAPRPRNFSPPEPSFGTAASSSGRWRRFSRPCVASSPRSTIGWPACGRISAPRTGIACWPPSFPASKPFPSTTGCSSGPTTC